MTERQFAVLLERAMTDRGAEGLAFDSIVASGPNGAIPHHSPPAGRSRPATWSRWTAVPGSAAITPT